MIMRGEAQASMVPVAAGTTPVSANGRIGGHLWSGGGAGGHGGSRTDIDIRMTGNDQDDVLTGTTLLGIDDSSTFFKDETFSGGGLPSHGTVIASSDKHFGVGRLAVWAEGGVASEY